MISFLSSLKTTLSRYKFGSSACIVCFFEETGEGQFHEIERVTRVIPSLYSCYSLTEEEEHLPFVLIVFSVPLPLPVNTVSRSSCFHSLRIPLFRCQETLLSRASNGILSRILSEVKEKRKPSIPGNVCASLIKSCCSLVSFRIICVHSPDLVLPVLQRELRAAIVFFFVFSRDNLCRRFP